MSTSYSAASLMDRLTSSLPPAPYGTTYDEEAATFCELVQPHWRNRRAERSVLTLPSHLPRSKGGSGVGGGEPYSAPGRAWCWKAFRPDPGGPLSDSLLVRAFVRRGVVTSPGVSPEARVMDLMSDPSTPPVPRFRVAVSIMAPGLPGGPSLPQGSPDLEPDAAMLASDATSAQPPVVVTEASRSAILHGADDLPDVPPNVSGIGCVTWQEALVVSASVPGSGGAASPPVVLRVQVLSELAGKDDEGGYSSRGSGEDANPNHFVVVTHVASSVDVGVAAPGPGGVANADPTHHRLRLLFQQPPSEFVAEHPAFPVLYLDLDLVVERRGWGDGWNPASLPPSSSPPCLVQFSASRFFVPTVLPGEVPPKVGVGSSRRRKASPSSPSSVVSGSSPSTVSALSLDLDSSLQQARKSEEREGRSAQNASITSSTARHSRRLSPEREQHLSPSHGVGMVGKVSEVILPMKQPPSYLTSRSAIPSSTSSPNSSGSPTLSKPTMVAPPLPPPLVSYTQAEKEAHRRLLTTLLLSIDDQVLRIKHARTGKGKKFVPPPGEMDALALALRRLPMGGRAKVEKDRLFPSAAVSSPPPLYQVPCALPFVDLDTFIPNGVYNCRHNDPLVLKRLASLAVASIHAPGGVTLPFLSLERAESEGSGVTGEVFLAQLGGSVAMNVPTQAPLALSGGFLPDAGGAGGGGEEVLLQILSMGGLSMHFIANTVANGDKDLGGAHPISEDSGTVLAVGWLPLDRALAVFDRGTDGGRQAWEGGPAELELRDIPLFAASEVEECYQTCGGTGRLSSATKSLRPICFLEGTLRVWPSTGGRASEHGDNLRVAGARAFDAGLEACHFSSRTLFSGLSLPQSKLAEAQIQRAGDRPSSVASLLSARALESFLPPPAQHQEKEEEGGVITNTPPPPPFTLPDPPYPGLEGKASDAGASALLLANLGRKGLSGEGAASALPLIRRLVAELDRRTVALKTCGIEIVKLRGALRMAREENMSIRMGWEERERAREALNDAVLLAALRDLGPTLLDAPAGPGPGLSAVAAMSAQQLLTSLRVADPSGERVVPTLLRRLVVVSHRYVQQRKANAALASETYLHRTRIRLLEREVRSLAGAVAAGGGSASASARESLGLTQTYHQLAFSSSSSLDSASTSRRLPGVYGGDVGGGSSNELDTLAKALLAAEAAMGVNVGALSLAGGGGGKFTSYTDAIVSGAASLDPSAPVSALAHARLLDQYAATVEALERLKEENARSNSSLGDLKEAATRQATLLLKLQESKRNDEALRATVRSQQDLVRRLESAVDTLQGQVGSMAEAASAAERKAARAGQEARHAREREEEHAERVDALERMPRMDAKEEGILKAQLAAKTQRVAVLEEQMVSNSAAFSRDLAALQARLMEVEGALADRDARQAAAGDALHHRLNRASDDAGERYAQSTQQKQEQPPSLKVAQPNRDSAAGNASSDASQLLPQYRGSSAGGSNGPSGPNGRASVVPPPTSNPYRSYEGGGSVVSRRGGASVRPVSQGRPEVSGEKTTSSQLDQDLKNIDDLLGSLL